MVYVGYREVLRLKWRALLLVELCFTSVEIEERHGAKEFSFILIVVTHRVFMYKSFNLVFVFNFFSICMAMVENFANYMYM